MYSKEDIINYFKSPIIKAMLKITPRDEQLEIGKWIRKELDGFQERPKE